MIPFHRFVPRPLDPRVLVHEIVLRYPEARSRYVYADQYGVRSLLGVIIVVPGGSER
jgi:hypothetical protein